MVEEQDFTCSLTSVITIFFKAQRMSCSHTQNFRLSEHFSDIHFPLSSMKSVQYWSHAPWAAIHVTYAKNFPSLSKKTNEKNKEKKKKGNKQVQLQWTPGI